MYEKSFIILIFGAAFVLSNSFRVTNIGDLGKKRGDFLRWIVVFLKALGRSYEVRKKDISGYC
jgi:hypothetical protein